ncbi:host attachment family protein [Paracoccus bogoriensis]|uniref:baeRF12 domain-containing protein n=1 Tax=Paracoccus bogoriensis TaxID=242065 RepID=UPI001C679908|nr:host attachment protein [Paracoccus bogoriensis]MBW7057770.1 host attachment family protein [Paracoccus bogoriensis]
MLPHNALVVVADGHSATLFRNQARHGIDLTDARRITPESLADPATTPELDEINTPRDAEEAAFAVELTRHLNGLVLKNKVEDIVIIADPSTLGVMRKHYHKELQFRLRRELAKTLTNADSAAIAQALT